ncbi:hypothetical protein [Agromyces silvae]|uniref:hypothetical protein n=1 Tax=Agromyces silvae TaxID=3388266 RepID=UPI00280B70BC|nr:hypothetical protein [Agromyces protaetiae]
MPAITDYYGISGAVPFVDVEITADNRLYVDPHAIRLSKGPQPFAAEAVECSDTFLQEVTACVINGPAFHRRGEDLLQHFVEPWETRLGMSEEGFHGHGGAAIVGQWIWKTLTDDVEALVRVGVLRQLEDLPLFVDGIDRDITSDLTTRIVFHPLARFTAAMVAAYPEFTAGEHVVKVFRKQVWNPELREWDEVEIALPVADGKPLLLVPKGWARPTLLMSAGRFYETSVLSFAQLEQAVLSSRGKLLKTPKDELKKQAGLGRGRATNLRVTKRAFDSEQDLLAVFKSFVASRLKRADSDGEAAA